MNTNPITVEKCPCCGSTAQVRETEIEQTEKGLKIYYECGCGECFVSVYEKVYTFGYAKKFQKSIDKQIKV